MSRCAVSLIFVLFCLSLLFTQTKIRRKRRRLDTRNCFSASLDGSRAFVRRLVREVKTRRVFPIFNPVVFFSRCSCLGFGARSRLGKAWKLFCRDGRWVVALEFLLRRGRLLRRSWRFRFVGRFVFSAWSHVLGLGLCSSSGRLRCVSHLPWSRAHLPT